MTREPTIDHDRLFKELLSTFFVEFLELFFPELVAYLNPASIEFLDKEIFSELTRGQRHEVDLVAKASFRDHDAFFLVHVENQAQPHADFAARMFGYFARLHEKYAVPVYPIAVFSYSQPERAEPDVYRVVFPDLDVLLFRFRVVQLNRLEWRNFLDRSNPTAAALMAKMRMDPADRPHVKLACLSLLAKLELDPARQTLISGFVDTYLKLTINEEQVFQTELAQSEQDQREGIMEIVTSWMEKGIEQGIEQGIERGIERGIEQGQSQGKRDEACVLVERLLRKRFGSVDEELRQRIAGLPLHQLEQLAEALLDFKSRDDVTAWLKSQAG